MPAYFGTAPGGSVYPWENRNKAYGSWFVHLLPYVEQGNVHQRVLTNVATCGQGGKPMNEPWCNGTWTPGTPGGIIIEQYNGHTYVYTSSSGGGCSGTYVNCGIWIDGVHELAFPTLQCLSDPTGDDTGLVYGYWGATNYLANYNAWGPGYGGVWAPALPFADIRDGLSNTVLFGEGYANCDRIGRIALYSWFYHNFGLDWYAQANTLMFQNKPREADCDNWRAQSGHPGGMNVALADGSVRGVSPGISQNTWTSALLPRDNLPLGNDW
jgi:prepilin-type processing-associated H-X9-DG protein